MLDGCIPLRTCILWLLEEIQTIYKIILHKANTYFLLVIEYTKLLQTDQSLEYGKLQYSVFQYLTYSVLCCINKKKLKVMYLLTNSTKFQNIPEHDRAVSSQVKYCVMINQKVIKSAAILNTYFYDSTLILCVKSVRL